MLKTFRIVALLEGVSYLLLMGASVYKRLPGGDDAFVKLLGYPHGFLFVLYILIAFLIKPDQKWSSKVFGIILLASILPFGTFYIDKKYLKA
ncbi:DUF3817 domain-containing protein [Olleya sp. HaHaR_3_96]|uniref:DUF3817 domain-containing protein n=1 Tax=Olleya sp. HaHaR_3_96 TaxID=2745560 RepID=UPI001C4EA427|nr:DUF3817 domain-containing protein [Olleya sp. HaHaR_3_96]QXP58917.1 DUF3817 domain-containing protein [Olleya sp. HaHaR_3_96]